MANKDENKQGTGIATKEQLQSKFGTFDAKEIEKEELNRPSVTTIDKAMINHGLVKLYNTKVRKKSEKVAESINHSRFLDICETFNLHDEVKVAYTNRKAQFTSQSDDLILYFANLKPSSLGEISHKEKRMIIAEAVESVLFDYFDIVTDLTPSKVSVSDLTIVCPIDSKELGINPRTDKLSNMNVKAIDYIFDAITKRKQKGE